MISSPRTGPLRNKECGGNFDTDDGVEPDDFVWKTPLELFRSNKLVNVCAPMVRYSKLPFRMLVRKYNCDLAFTPMIIADSFLKSMKARDNEFTTCREDRPLIVQFAAHNGHDFADAAEVVAPFADGVDLNCGCPQKWAMAEGFGAQIIRSPELVKDIVSQAKARVNNPDFTVSIKMRIHDDVRDTVDMCQKMEAAGVSWIGVHGRTKDQRKQPVNLEAIKLVRENVGIPVIANGDVKSLDDAQVVHDRTGVQGVMAARGILMNPAMFAGHDCTPIQCVKDWVDTALSMGTPHSTFHHHLMFMLEKIMPRAERRVFNALASTTAVLDYLHTNYDI